jgi:hypothetical protein
MIALISLMQCSKMVLFLQQEDNGGHATVTGLHLGSCQKNPTAAYQSGLGNGRCIHDIRKWCKKRLE